MQYRRLGDAGLQLSAISLGCWATIGDRLDHRSSLELLEHAYECGVNFFDNAETYGDGAAERALGRALRKLRWPRETYVVSGKVFWGTHRRVPNTWGLSRKHIIEGCHATLRRLELDHLDLYLCHRADANTPIGETVRAMSDLVSRGLVLYWGTSEWPIGAVRAAHDYAREHNLYPPAAEQLQYNMLVRGQVEDEFAELRAQTGIGLTTWSPLAYGLLAGRYDEGFPVDARLARPDYQWLREYALGTESEQDGTLERVRSLNALARSLDLTPSQLALAWVLRNPDVTSAISGASSLTQLKENLASIEVVTVLNEPLLQEINNRLGYGSPSRQFREEALHGGK